MVPVATVMRCDSKIRVLVLFVILCCTLTPNLCPAKGIFKSLAGPISVMADVSINNRKRKKGRKKERKKERKREREKERKKERKKAK
jgi:hypothetical protein